MEEPIRVLLTGAAGAVGQEVVRELVARAPRLVTRTFELPCLRTRRRLWPWRGQIETHWGDLRDPAAVARAAEGADVVIHAGALIPPRADREPALAAATNEGGTANLLAALQARAGREGRPAWVIYTSSISIYGDRVAEPWIRVGDPLRPSLGDHYAETKLRAEDMLRASGLPFTILRLTGILGPHMKPDPLMFHMPLDTSLEVCTNRDCGYALAEAALHPAELQGRTFNLGGGPRGRTLYREFLERWFELAGLGRGFLPEEAFAARNFHCGYYADGDELERVLHFQREGLEELFEQVRARFGPLTRAAARLARPLVRTALLAGSEPLHARATGDQALVERFF
ncbi:MAG TPA: NAD(P)-dependent oxidoreductase [Myxococcota bacterium]|nr:NAD(P)-dependent oxidoreductase [Myxococcota bacterium]HRY96127.1 NAD(P)-dependent oxidoreductase [Myxococcota bacterium]HSA24772.1 NAD(P)-dependent oxidoreductase [Myxococcota bacterium]